jgi:hypothetical protein
MKSYNYETPEFGVSDAGIHLLRSRFNYETILFDQVERVAIRKGKELNNWPVVLLIGIALAAFSVYYTLKLFYFMGDPQVRVIYIEQIIIPAIPFMVGGYCIYSSTRNGMVLMITTIQNKSQRFPLKELEKKDQLMSFQDFLKTKLGARLSINVS